MVKSLYLAFDPFFGPLLIINRFPIRRIHHHSRYDTDRNEDDDPNHETGSGKFECLFHFFCRSVSVVDR